MSTGARATHKVPLSPAHMTKLRHLRQTSTRRVTLEVLGCNAATLDRVLGIGTVRPHVAERLEKRIDEVV